MRIVVYTRLDSPILDLVASAMSFGMQMANAAGASLGPIDLEIYNNTGTGITGYHYDPVFPMVQHSAESNMPDLGSSQPALLYHLQKKRQRAKAAAPIAPASSSGIVAPADPALSQRSTPSDAVVDPPSLVALRDNLLLRPTKEESKRPLQLLQFDRQPIPISWQSRRRRQVAWTRWWQS